MNWSKIMFFMTVTSFSASQWNLELRTDADADDDDNANDDNETDGSSRHRIESCEKIFVAQLEKIKQNKIKFIKGSRHDKRLDKHAVLVRQWWCLFAVAAVAAFAAAAAASYLVI